MTPGESSSEDDAVSVVGDQLTDVGLLSAGVWVFCGVPWGAVSEDQVPPSFLVSVFVTLSVSVSTGRHRALFACISPFLALQASCFHSNTCCVCILAGAGAWGLWALLLGKQWGSSPLKTGPGNGIIGGA